jgi:hypothetical protein
VSTERPTHPDRDLEKLLIRVEAKHWRVEKRRRYFICKCDCGDHLKTVHLTPSDPNYLLNVTKWFERQSCWKGETP